jgi:hypothetical protein
MQISNVRHQVHFLTFGFYFYYFYFYFTLPGYRQRASNVRRHLRSIGTHPSSPNGKARTRPGRDTASFLEELLKIIC